MIVMAGGHSPIPLFLISVLRSPSFESREGLLVTLWLVGWWRTGSWPISCGHVVVLTTSESKSCPMLVFLYSYKSQEVFLS